MDRNRIAGVGKQVKGAAKEIVGKVTGDKSTELKGRGEKLAGKVQAGYGKVKDEVRAVKQQERESRSSSAAAKRRGA